MRSTRHVLATTFTVAVGFIPLVLDGGTFWPPMAMVISAGVIGATVLAIYFVPSVHLLIVGRKAATQPAT
jgi:multidrug efflux pump subunit AcrB